jgi:hypothetical protein
MTNDEITIIDYLSNVFSGLSTEKQDNALKTARSLLVIQKNDACHTKQEKTKLNTETYISVKICKEFEK